MSQQKGIENKESKTSSSLLDNPENKALYDSALRILQEKENKYTLEDALKLLKQRPNLIILINVIINADHEYLQNHLQNLKHKSNEQLGEIISHLEKFSDKKQDQWWVLKNGSQIWQEPFYYHLLEIVLSLDSLPKEVSSHIYSHGVLNSEMARIVESCIDRYKKNQLTAKQLQALFEPFSYDSLDARIGILNYVSEFELSDKNFKTLVLTPTPETLRGMITNMRVLLFHIDRHREQEFLKSILELFCTLEGQNQNLLIKTCGDLQREKESAEDFLERFKARPNLISLVHQAIELGFNMPSFLSQIDRRSNDELGIMASCLERFSKPSQEFFTALVSMNGLNRPEVQVFLNSLPVPADEKLYKQAIDFVQAGIKYVNEKLLGTTRLAKFLEPIPKDCKDVSAFIESRRNLFVADLWMSARMFYYKGEKPKQVPQKDMAEYIAPFIRPDSSD